MTHRDDDAPTLGRRSFLACGLGGSLGLFLGRPLLAAPPADAARACVLVWLRGGPSQLETFDPKPGTPTGGPTRAIDTAVPGLRFAEHLPALAERAERLAVVRSLTSREGDHRRASYLLHTGFSPSPALRHPTLGSLVSAELGGPSGVPAFVSLGRDPVGPGYRGAAHGAYVVDGAGALLERAPGLDAERVAARRELLERLEAPFARRSGLRSAGEHPSARAEAYARADGLLRGPLRGALDLSAEPEGTRDAYGRGGPGSDLLTARRLVEAGVRAVEVEVPGWDDHRDLFRNLPGRARALDRALAALLDDLADRGRLASTLVLCMGEFGRTPDVNGRGGRDHYPRAFSALLAGGGVPGGRVVGATTPDGREVAERPVRVPDLFATVARRLGLDPDDPAYAGDRPVRLVAKAGEPIEELLPG